MNERQVAKLKKRKFGDLNVTELLSTLTILFKGGKLSIPTEVCEIIHGDNTKEHKAKRTKIIEILSQDFKMTKKQAMST